MDELDLSDMRRQIGIVPQEPIIVPGTIADNIAYGISEASSGDVEYASLMAGAREFILSLPNGYETYVGENGMLLSGGQRQRIAIARALIRHPCLLILDEPTNHLDAASYHVLMNNLRELEKRTTMLVITHNPDVVEMFEVVYVLREGALTIMHRKGLRMETSVPLSSRLNVFANSAPTSKR